MFIPTLAGCATPTSQGPANAAKDSASESSTHDSTPRATLALADLEPAVACPAPVDPPKPLSQRASKQVAKANELINDMRYTEAALALERALRFEPNHPKIHLALAKLHWHAGNLERARVHAAKVMERTPNDPVAQYLMGRWHLAQHDPELALQSFRVALACSQGDPPAPETVLCYYYMAQVLADEGYWSAALKAYEDFERQAYDVASAANNPELSTLVQRRGAMTARARATLLEHLGRFAEAANALRPLFPSNNVDLALQRVSLWLRAGENEKALHALDKVTVDDRRIVELFYKIRNAAGTPEQAIQDVRAMLEADPTKSNIRLALADLLVKLDQPQEAVHELRTYLKANPSADLIRAKLVEYAVSAKDWAQVLDVCAEALTRGTGQIAQFEQRIREIAKDKDAAKALLADRPDASAQTLYFQGLVADGAGKPDQAEALLKKSLAMKPDAVAARVALANVYLNEYAYDKALDVALHAPQDRDADGRIAATLARIYDRLDQFEPAEREAKAAIQRNRTNDDTRLLLAELYFRFDKPRLAQQQLRAIIDHNPSHEAAREMLASIYFRDRKIDAAISEYDELRSVSSNPLTQARCSAILKHFPEYDAQAYRTDLLEAIKRHGGDAPTWLAVASTYDEFIQADLQREAYQKALDVEPDNEEAWIGLIRANRRTLRYEDAVASLLQLLKRRPNHYSWQYLLIDSYWTLRNFDAALAVVRTQLAKEGLEPRERLRLRFRLLQTLSLAGRDDAIIATLSEWLKDQPDNLEWTMQLAGAYDRQEAFDKAVDILTALMEKRPAARDQLLPQLIAALIGAKRYDRAAQYALDWVYDDPENQQAVGLLATVLARSDRLDDALELIRNRLLQSDRRESLQNQWIVLLQSAGRHDECIELLDALTDSLLRWFRVDHGPQRDHREVPALAQQRGFDPDPPYTAEHFQERSFQLRVNLAVELISAKRFRQAEKLLTDALNDSRTPRERFEYLRRLAFCYQVMGRIEQTETIQTQALALVPHDVGLNNDLAYGWIDRGVRLDEAEKMIRFALAKAPRQAAYLDTFGWLLYKKGQLREAKTWLTRSDESRSDDDPVVLDHLGDTCWRLGEKEQAITYWERAIKGLKELPAAQIQVADIHRVSEVTPEKIESAKSNGQPKVAGLGQASQSPVDQAGEQQ